MARISPFAKAMTLGYQRGSAMGLFAGTDQVLPARLSKNTAWLSPS